MKCVAQLLGDCYLLFVRLMGKWEDSSYFLCPQNGRNTRYT